MVSKFEDTLLRYSRGSGRIRAALFEQLTENERRTLRGVSRTFHDLVDHAPDQLFRHLFLAAPWPGYRDSSTLRALAPYCHNLTITIGSEFPVLDEIHKGWLRRKVRLSEPIPSKSADAPKRSARQRWKDIRIALRSSTDGKEPAKGSPMATSNCISSSSTQSSLLSIQRPVSEPLADLEAQFDWADMLSRFRQLRSIAIRTYGDPAWPGGTDVENALVTLRSALETGQFPYLRNLRLAPIHAMGIVHLRWSGFGAFGTILPMHHAVWQSLHKLDLQMHNPFTAARKLSDNQEVLFKKMLYEYVRSFARTVKCLRFVWLDGEGPSPITLDMDEALSGTREPIIWHALEELWLGNMILPHQTIRLLPERTMRSVKMKTLRSTHRHSRMMFEEADAWVEIQLGNLGSQGRPRMMSRWSSVYSQ